MIVTIHQPEHLPWLGFFHKMLESDCFIVLDNVQYRRRYFQNRNRIRTSDGERWITVPVKGGDRDETRICDVEISERAEDWRRKNLELIRHSYCHAPAFGQYWFSFAEIYGRSQQSLCEFNIDLLKFIMASLGVEREFIRASELKVRGSKGDLILELCRVVGADHYLSGISGRDYLDLEAFAKTGIGVSFQEFHHPIYRQLYDPFVPCMSVVDLLFNYGPESTRIILGEGVPVMEDLFL